MFLFLVGSAINHFKEEEESICAFSRQERFEQTLNTINSIRKKVPNSYILLYEVSETDIEEKYRVELESRVDLFINTNSDTIIKLIYENLHNDPSKFTYGKSLLECRALQLVLNCLQEYNLFSDSLRVFKLSGRYLLNDDFNINDYNSRFLINKYVMKYFDYEERFTNDKNFYNNIYGCKGSIVTALWSFDRYLFNDIKEVLYKSFKYMEKAIQVSCGMDIEHSFYHFINKEKIVYAQVLGVDLIKGMTGETFSQ